MSRVTHIRKLLWGCGCLTCHILNLILALIALGQVGLVFLNVVQKDVPLPDQLTEWVINQMGPENIEAEWGNASFDLRAGLLLEDFKIRNASTEQIIATAEEAHLQWSPLHLLLPSLTPIREIEAREVDIYVPVSHSPSGLNEPVLFIKHAAMKDNDGQLVISSLILETGEVQVHFQGTAPLHQLLERSGESKNPKLNTILQTLRRVPEDLVAFVDIDWQLFPSGDHLFKVSGLIPEIDYSKAQLSSLSGEARIRLSDDGLSVLNLKLDGFLSLMEELPKLPFVDELLHLDPVPFQLMANGPLRTMDKIRLPSRIQLNLHPRDEALPFHHLLLRTSLWQDISPIHWIASSPRAFSEGWAHPIAVSSEESKPDFPFKLTFRGYIPHCTITQFLPGPPAHRLLDGARADELRLNGTFDPVSMSLRGSVAADGVFIGQTHFARLHTDILLNKTDLELVNIHVRKAYNESAFGSYFHNFPSSDFSLNAGGSILPTSLDIILGAWWTRIFANIEASQPLPADVTVWGYWRDRKSLQSITYVNGEKGSYRGVDIPELELRVRSNSKWANLEELRATFPGGAVTGSIAIRSGLDPQKPLRPLILNLRSDAPWEALVGASGITSLAAAEFTKNPHVRIRGTFWNDSGKGFNAQPQALLSLGLTQHEGICRIQGLELSGMSLTGEIEKQQLVLSGITGQFAEGVFTGNITVNDWQDAEKRERRYDLQLFDAHFGSASRQLSGIMGFTSNQTNPLPSEVYEGRLDAKALIQFRQEPHQTEGTGSIALRQAKLGQIHILGGLSRFLSAMGLDFSSLELNSLTLDWLLSNRILRINKGLVTGPALRLQLAGSVDLESRQMAMQADVTLIKGMIGMVLLPVSENLQFDLKGTIENPNWKIRFSPFRWLQDNSSSSDNAPEL